MMDEKYQRLLSELRALDGVVVAFSGGVDSTFLLAAASRALGERVLAVTGESASVPERELAEAVELAARIGARHRVVPTRELDDPGYRPNPPDRCYHCKRLLFGQLREVADLEGLAVVVEGSNADDCGDYRPGSLAATEIGVRSPLAEVGLTKQEIRELSRELGLPTWDKPAMACLASRIPYGDEITVERLGRVERAEGALRDLGIRQLRVRDHGDVARIEVPVEELSSLMDSRKRREVVEAVRRAGYRYVALDLEGYRTGAMNESLGAAIRYDKS